MVALADSSALRDWVTFRKDDPFVRVDVLEKIWYLDKLRLSSRAPSDVIDEATGRYLGDQLQSWFRTFNPFYWVGRVIDWLVGEAFNIVRLLVATLKPIGVPPPAARYSPLGNSSLGLSV
jgi:hypothetical protein